MEKEFIPYDRALRLKALGFDEPCFGSYVFGDKLSIKYSEDQFITESCCLAPTFPQAFRWLMQFPQIKKYRYNIALYSDGTYSLKDGKDAIYEYLSGEDCVDKLIEIIEQK